ncbi:Sec-independent protein translocase protein TatB [Chachezhania antarctica]|uniref:Sec-independent protein translocase protein TatB n=1 Tax=Chachezhania antarctica TaxID=2340860 RepID=UPI000EB01BC0|nr:Sec-independent protein translocase protein TatB [Chachezhania antarctica]|tara:strand:- start:958 stop:1494 length:537 start_codon:yes stop_codon:yes gene_type:complete
MFDLGWTELLLIGIVALIVVGPKDLPVLFRSVGQFVGKARGMAREFSRAMNDAADESGMRDIQKTFKSATNPVGSAMDGVRKAASDFTSSFDPMELDEEMVDPKPDSKKGPKKPVHDPDSETGKLAAQKAETAKRMEAIAARKVAERRQREAEEAMQRAEEAEARLAPSDPPADTDKS